MLFNFFVLLIWILLFKFESFPILALLWWWILFQAFLSETSIGTEKVWSILIFFEMTVLTWYLFSLSLPFFFFLRLQVVCGSIYPAFFCQLVIFTYVHSSFGSWAGSRSLECFCSSSLAHLGLLPESMHLIGHIQGKTLGIIIWPLLFFPFHIKWSRCAVTGREFCVFYDNRFENVYWVGFLSLSVSIMNLTLCVCTIIYLTFPCPLGLEGRCLLKLCEAYGDLF